jgi:hypothetical protein
LEPSFPAFGFRRPEQKGWTGLELKAQKLLSDFKTKKQEASHLAISSGQELAQMS